MLFALKNALLALPQGDSQHCNPCSDGRLYLGTAPWYAQLYLPAPCPPCLGIATSIGWLAQPTKLIYGMVKRPFGRDTRDQPSLFLSVFIKKTAWYKDTHLCLLTLNTLLLFFFFLFSARRSSPAPSVVVKNKLTTYVSLLVGALVTDVGLLDKVIDGCLIDFSLEEMEDRPVPDFNKFKRLVAKLPVASWKVAVALVQSDPSLKNNFEDFLVAFRCHQLVPPMTCSQAIRELGNLYQGELRVPVYKERFHLLAERSGLDAKDCVDLFFDGLQPTLKSAINIWGHGNSLEETCKELKELKPAFPLLRLPPTEPWKNV